MNYPLVALGKVVDVKGGKRLPAGHDFASFQSPFPYIRARDIYGGRIKIVEPAFLREETQNLLRQYTVRKGDVCIVIVGANVGDVGSVPEHLDGANLTENAVKLVNFREMDQDFVKYFLLTTPVQQEMKYIASGAAQPKLGIYKIKELLIPFPSLIIQRRIASILSTYDDLIENNTRRIALLEESTRQLYREWFVHLRFPGHESVRVVDGVPEMWEKGAFTNFIDVLSGGTPSTIKKEYWVGDIPWFTPQDLSGNFYALDTERKITELGLSKCNSKLYPRNTVFITARGTVGKCTLASVPMAMSQTNYALFGKGHLNQFFVFLLTLSMVDELKQQATGAVFDTIIVDTFRRMQIIVPTKDILDAFVTVCEPSFLLIENLQKSNKKLAEARDLLLPRLMNGEIAV